MTSQQTSASCCTRQFGIRDEAAGAWQRRGTGLGRVLVGLVLDGARAQHLTLISLNVAAGNLPAIRTYQRWGFVADETQLRDEVIAMTYVG